MKETQENKPDVKQLWQLLSDHKPSRNRFVIMLLLIILATGLELVIPIYSSYLVDGITAFGVDYTVIVGLVALVILAAVSEGVLAWYGAHMGESTNLSLRFSLIGRLVNTKQSVMNNEHSAELSARIVNDSMSVKTILAEDLIGFVSGIISLVAVIVVMFVLDWRLTLVLVSSVLVGFIIITPLAMSMRGIGQAMQEAEANLLTYVTDCARSAKTIRAHNAGQDAVKHSKGLLSDSFRHAMREARVVAMIGPVANLVLMMSMVAILAFSAHWIAQGTMTLGTVTAFLIYLFGLAFPLISLGMFFSNLQRAAGAASRLNEINKFETEALGGATKLETIKGFSVDNLSFISDDKTILQNVSVEFPATGMSMIVGESGSGKSTFIQQLLGFYPETHEFMTINGQPFNHFSLKSIRENMAWVDQEIRLFNGSIRDNLTLGSGQFDDEQLVDCLERVGLKNWLGKIGHDLSQMVSEQQQQFSGGERQRFAIARALLRKPTLLVLDEPTSALDHENEQSLMQLLRRMSTDLHVIMVTHNRGLIASTDRLLEMSGGKMSCQTKAVA